MYTIEPEPVDAIETDYNEFWRDIVETNGQLDPKKVKRELYDYSVVIREVSKVYDELTGGRISKPDTSSGFVIGAVLERLCEDDAADPGDERRALGDALIAFCADPDNVEYYDDNGDPFCAFCGDVQANGVEHFPDCLHLRARKLQEVD